MDYADRVFLYLTEIDPGTKIDLTKLKERNRFICAVNYLFENYINPINWQWNETWTYLRKLKS